MTETITMNRHTPRTTTRGRIVLASLCLVALAGTPGCIEEDRLSAAIDDVSTQLEALAAPGTAIPGSSLRNTTYNEAINTLRPLINEGTNDQKGNAWLLIARAELGLAADPIADVADARREMASFVSSIRAEIVAYRQVAALAAAAESFDPDAEIAEIQAKISERVAAARDVQAEMDAVTQQIAQFEALAEQARSASDEHRRAEASLRSQMMSLSAQDALPLAAQAAEQRSRADDLAADADRRTAEADVLRPQITAFEGEIDRLAEQQRLLEESIESLNAQRTATAAEAAEFRSRAGDIADRITEAVTSANAYRTGPLQQAYDAAISALDTAAGSAGKASAKRAASSLLRAEISHTLGGTALAQANTVRSFANAISEAVDDAGITGGGLSAVRSTVIADAGTARDRGMATLREARDSYESAGVRGEGAERITDVVASINELLGEPAEQPAGEEAPADTESDG